MDDRQSQIQQILHQATTSPASASIQLQTSAQFTGNIFCLHYTCICARLFHIEDEQLKCLK